MIQFVKQGSTVVDNQKFKERFLNLPDGHYTIKKTQKIRSINQNRLYWDMLSHIAEYTGEYDRDWLHSIMKAKFRIKSTTDLTTEEFTKYMKWIKQRSYDFLWVILPDYFYD